MARLNLFEFEDQAWFPRVLRRYMVDFLEFMGNLRPDSFSHFAGRLKVKMASLGDTQIFDLCSGGGGPLRAVLTLLEKENYPVTATLSDLYPNREAFLKTRAASRGKIDFLETSIDATNVPSDVRGFRLLSNSFHHFNPEQARAILADAVAKRRGIAVLEVADRAAATVLSVLLASVVCFVAVPFMKPFSLSRLFFTYLIPAIPLLVLFDGLASCYRAYSLEELRALTHSLENSEGYLWEIGKMPIPKTPLRLTYLIGTPR